MAIDNTNNLNNINDLESIRKDFPCLNQKIYNNKSLVYFDSGATALKPQCVIDAVSNYYQSYSANVHRAVHYLSSKATDQYENTREIIKNFIQAESTSEIIFTKGATESINLIVNSLRLKLQKGDEVIITEMEHHANIVPWVRLQDEIGIVLKIAPIIKDYNNPCLDLDQFKSLFSNKTKFVSCIYTSNVTGMTNPIKEIIEYTHQYNLKNNLKNNLNNSISILIDASQTIVHQEINVKDLKCDYLVFSSHKIYGPTGVGVLYARNNTLKNLAIYQSGGDMVESVRFDKGIIYRDAPAKFEAGTPNIAGVIGLGAALKYIQNKLDWIKTHEQKLIDYFLEQFKYYQAQSQLGDMVLLGWDVNKKSKSNLNSNSNSNQNHRAPVFSFASPSMSLYDLAILIDQMGVAVRFGRHCAEPLIQACGFPTTLRASLGMYNSCEEIDSFFKALVKAYSMLKI